MLPLSLQTSLLIGKNDLKKFGIGLAKISSLLETKNRDKTEYKDAITQIMNIEIEQTNLPGQIDINPGIPFKVQTKSSSCLFRSMSMV